VFLSPETLARAMLRDLRRLIANALQCLAGMIDPE